VWQEKCVRQIEIPSVQIRFACEHIESSRADPAATAYPRPYPTMLYIVLVTFSP